MWCSLAVPVLQGTVRNRNEVQKAPMSSPIGAVWRWAPKLNERAAAARSEECDNDTQTAMMGHEIIYNTTLGQRGTTPRQFLSHVFAAAVLRCFPVRRVSQNCGIGHMKISGAKKGRGGGLDEGQLVSSPTTFFRPIAAFPTLADPVDVKKSDQLCETVSQPSIQPDKVDPPIGS